MNELRQKLGMTVLVCLVVFQGHGGVSAAEPPVNDHVSRGNAYLGQGALLEAFIEFAKALELQPDSPLTNEGFRNVYQAFLKLSEEEAVAHIQKAQQAVPELSDVLNLALARLYLERGLYEKAIVPLERIQALERTSPLFSLDFAYLTKGEIYRRMGLTSTAIVQLEEALRVNPASKDIHVSLGYAYQEYSDNEKALFHFQQALELDPDGENAETIETLIESLQAH